MGYLKIQNLYKETDILLMKEVYCLEKIHGTSAHISYKMENDQLRAGSIYPIGQHPIIRYFAGGVNHEEFVKLFHEEVLLSKFAEIYNGYPITVFGEAYGGKCQGMSGTYGKQLRFVAFDVKMGERWLSVPQAEDVVKNLGLEFVHYVKTSTNLEDLNRERDRDSVQAIRNGLGENHPSEGIVIRPIIELTKNNGERLIAKHKKEVFRETKSVKPVNAEKLEILREAQAVADEWVTEMRLSHVVDKLGVDVDVVNIPIIIRGMLVDIQLESVGEVEWNKECNKSVGKATADLVKEVCKNSIS
jgi:hypothetical protein